MSTTNELRDTLSPDDKSKVESLEASEDTIKGSLRGEIWALIECIRQHPEISALPASRPTTPDEIADALLFGHYVSHCRKVTKLADLAITINEQMVDILIGKTKEARHDA